jgi:hypothetical protein
VQTIELDMPDNVKHVLKVSGFTFYNSTDIDFYTDVGYTAHLTNGNLWLAPTTFTPRVATLRAEQC